MDQRALHDAIIEARQRTLELVADLTDAQMMPPRMDIVNPFLWEIGHVGWFQEKFVLRDIDGTAPLRPDGDSMFDSIAIAHDTRWDLPVPSRQAVVQYLALVRDRVAARLGRALAPEDEYRNWLAVFHEDMHDEAFTYMRQTMAYPPPRLSVPQLEPADAGPLPGDVAVPGGRFVLGATGAGFAFDNEVPPMEVELQPFRISRAAVTQAEFATFVDAGGYEHPEFWSRQGRNWLLHTGATQPLYWRKDGIWLRRHFDQWRELEPHRPVIHVSWYEAEAWCNWARRRLPTEAEWEAAAAAEPDGKGGLKPAKRRYPWGEEAATPARANFDWRAMDTVDVGACPEGDSAFGCRQMLGNVWEWTASVFGPFPGFTPGPYREYSEPVFYTRRVLRGGCWASRSRLLWNTWRNFFEPHRRDVFAGFRTCAQGEGPRTMI